MPTALPLLRQTIASLAQTLARTELDSFAKDEDAAASLRKLRDRVQRDLSPRLELGPDDATALLVGIAGPNNVGKSSLFNAVAGAHLSPARAEGGLTKQCLAACNPSLWDGRLRAFLERRYEVVPLPAAEAAHAPVDQPGPSGRLYLVTSERMPPGLLVLDTPDFDSLYKDNRINAEALLVTADVVFFVVSRQTYQNLALVDFLGDAIGHGRPWAVLYNEATRPDVARAHLDKLAADVGRRPVARFYATHQPDVEEGRALLRTEPLDGGPGLLELFSRADDVARLKAEALGASLRDAARELAVLSAAVQEATVGAERLAARLRHELRSVGSQAALKGVPADVLIEAFRDELDARSTAHRWIRRPFRGLAAALGFVGKKVRRAFTGPAPSPPAPQSLTEDALKDGVRRMAEALANEIAAWRGDDQTRDLLREALGPALFARLEQPLQIERPDLQAQDRTALYDYSRRLIAAELPGDAREEAMQAVTTLLYSVPASAAAVVTVATGGIGHDAVVWAGTLLTTPLLERFIDLLGASVRARVTKKWADAHGESLSRGMEERLFAGLLAHLDRQVSAARQLSKGLDDAALALAEAA